ncbi:hypothetical protein CRG98_004264 [Punica granatum]|uniref:Uncharacterized protein n=1 Tax=Punica granatum TaxID=22663 RepID=A0A2I0L3P4_PUNGR|nr:hypothetical protein CRG98_004264 [Punica granatum]
MERPSKDCQCISKESRRVEDTSSDHQYDHEQQAFQFLSASSSQASSSREEHRPLPTDQCQWQSPDTNCRPSSPNVQNHQQPSHGFCGGSNGTSSSRPTEVPQQSKDYDMWTSWTPFHGPHGDSQSATGLQQGSFSLFKGNPWNFLNIDEDIKQGSSSSSSNRSSKNRKSVSSVHGTRRPPTARPSSVQHSTPPGFHKQYPNGLASSSKAGPPLHPPRLGPSKAHLDDQYFDDSLLGPDMAASIRALSLASAVQRKGPRNRVSTRGPVPVTVPSTEHQHQHQHQQNPIGLALPSQAGKPGNISEFDLDMAARASFQDLAKIYGQQPDSPPRPTSPETLRLLKQLDEELPPPTPYVPDDLSK